MLGHGPSGEADEEVHRETHGERPLLLSTQMGCTVSYCVSVHRTKSGSDSILGVEEEIIEDL